MRELTRLSVWFPIAVGVTLAASTFVEFLIARREHAASPPLLENDDGTARVIRLVGAGSLLAAILVAIFVPDASMSLAKEETVIAGAGLVWVGSLLRLWSATTLGRFYRRTVAIEKGHELLRTGPYRYCAHPGYVGGIVTFTGFGVITGNWVSIALCAVGSTVSYVPRIRVENRVLREHFGPQ